MKSKLYCVIDLPLMAEFIENVASTSFSLEEPENQGLAIDHR